MIKKIDRNYISALYIHILSPIYFINQFLFYYQYQYEEEDLSLSLTHIFNVETGIPNFNIKEFLKFEERKNMLMKLSNK